LSARSQKSLIPCLYTHSRSSSSKETCPRRRNRLPFTRGARQNTHSPKQPFPARTTPIFLPLSGMRYNPLSSKCLAGSGRESSAGGFGSGLVTDTDSPSRKVIPGISCGGVPLTSSSRAVSASSQRMKSTSSVANRACRPSSGKNPFNTHTVSLLCLLATAKARQSQPQVNNVALTRKMSGENRRISFSTSFQPLPSAG